MSIDFEDDANTGEITTDALQNIPTLAADVVRNEKEVAGIEAQLKTAKAKLRKVQEMDLPEAMGAVNMDTFTTTDGLSVSVKETLYASIAAKNKPAAAKWLMENELGALIKEDINIAFDSEQHEQVVKTLKLLQQNGVTNVKTGESMNTSSIKSAIKELLEAGKEVPLELFGAHFARKAIVK